VQEKLSLNPNPSATTWGKSVYELVKAVYHEPVMDRNASHLAEQIAVKAFLPVVAISPPRALTSTNIPWIFR
jgi:branched-chain amino acid transport system substrate-binding protein